MCHPTSRCCAYCYHYAKFYGHNEEICELTGKPKKNPNLYTNCKQFGYVDMVTGAKVMERDA